MAYPYDYSIKWYSPPVVYTGRNNTFACYLRADGTIIADLSAITRAVVNIGNVAIDSTVEPTAFDWTTHAYNGNDLLTFNFGAYDLTPGLHAARLYLYSSVATSGLVYEASFTITVVEGESTGLVSPTQIDEFETFRTQLLGTDVAQQVKGVYYVSTSASITNHGDAAVTGSLQNQINAAYTANAHTVVLPPGDFPVTGTSSIILKNRMKLIGGGGSLAFTATGPRTRIVKTGTGPVFTLDQTHPSVLYNVEVSGLDVVGVPADATNYGFDLRSPYGSSGMVIRDVGIFDTGSHGIYALQTSGSWRFQDFVFERLGIGDMASTHYVMGDGIHLAGITAEGKIRDSVIFRPRGNCIRIVSDSGVASQNISIDRVTLQSPGYGGAVAAYGLYATDLWGGSIRDSYIEGAIVGSNPAGIALTGTVTAAGGTQISGNLFSANVRHVYVTGSVRNIPIIGNIFYWNSSSPVSAPTCIYNGIGAGAGILFVSNEIDPATQTTTNDTNGMVLFVGSDDGLSANLKRLQVALTGTVSTANDNAVAMYSTNAAASLVNRLAVGGGSDTPLLTFSNGLYPKFGTTQTAVGAAGAASALPATPSGYFQIRVGSTDYVVPYYAK